MTDDADRPLNPIAALQYGTDEQAVAGANQLTSGFMFSSPKCRSRSLRRHCS
jgi:hypothetical protein